MKSNNVIIGILLIIIIILIAGLGFFLMSNGQNNPINAVNDTANQTNESDKVVNATLSEDNSQKHYDDWQKDYETGEYDEDGNPIYRSVISTSGGQHEPGIYEAYWSANGPISEEKIG